jgi:hypothetical protein
MKRLITYEFDPTYGNDAPYWAKTVMNGRSVCRCGESYTLAKGRLLDFLRECPTAIEPIPAAEEVEI